MSTDKTPELSSLASPPPGRDPPAQAPSNSTNVYRAIVAGGPFGGFEESGDEEARGGDLVELKPGEVPQEDVVAKDVGEGAVGEVGREEVGGGEVGVGDLGTARSVREVR